MNTITMTPAIAPMIGPKEIASSVVDSPPSYGVGSYGSGSINSHSAGSYVVAAVGSF